MNNAVQEEFWSTSAGRSWIALQSEMDFILRPVLDLVLQKACLSDGDRVLDVGCGTGASILEALKKVGNNGHVTGIDISQIMLDYAKTRLKKSSNFLLLREDAQLYDFKYERVDALISRFGVMFFENTTAAFSNLSRALVPEALLTFAAWGPASQNPFFIQPASIANHVLGSMPKVDRNLPGPFAFESPERTIPLLEAAGLQDITVESIPLLLYAPESALKTAELMCNIGPASSALIYFKPIYSDRVRLVSTLAEWLQSCETSKGIELSAQINLYQAKKAY